MWLKSHVIWEYKKWCMQKKNSLFLRHKYSKIGFEEPCGRLRATRCSSGVGFIFLSFWYEAQRIYHIAYFFFTFYLVWWLCGRLKAALSAQLSKVRISYCPQVIVDRMWWQSFRNKWKSQTNCSWKFKGQKAMKWPICDGVHGRFVMKHEGPELGILAPWTCRKWGRYVGLKGPLRVLFLLGF